MRSRRAKWVSGIGALVLIGGVIVANFGSGVRSAGAQAAPPNPLTVIINKLDQILTAIGGIDVQEGNHTLRWDRVLPAAQRFVVLADFNNQAVLDNETGLVWEQAPSASTFNWVGAIDHCANREVGGRKGWHLPMREQVASLVDSSNVSPSLPTGHPFTNIQLANYWSATTAGGVPAGAWFVAFNGGFLNGTLKTFNNLHAWCVRGGQSFDGNTHNTLH